MSGSSQIWGSHNEDEAIASLIYRATIDWMEIGALVGDVAYRIGRDAPFRDEVAALGELVGVLIDNNILPGDLGTDPDFQPWPGTRQERIDRIVRETRELGDMPRPGQIAWFHYVPPGDDTPPDAGRIT